MQFTLLDLFLLATFLGTASLRIFEVPRSSWWELEELASLSAHCGQNCWIKSRAGPLGCAEALG